MADGKLPLAGDLHPNVTRHCVIWVQGARWHFRALHGYRSNIWAHGRYTCEGPLSVSLATSRKILVHPFEFDRAYPTSGMFAVCQPDLPCITPGTYAFLGAAAALRYVVVRLPWLIVDHDVRAAASCASQSRSWSSCSSSLAL